MFAQAVKKIFLIAVLFAAPANVLWAEETEEVEDTGDIDLWNPFFLPYKKDLVLDVSTIYKSNPSQFSLPNNQGGITTKDKEYFTGVAARYGITDRFSLGAEANYMLRQDYSETRSGFAATSPDTSSANSGFFDFGLIMDFRLLGKYRKDWYANMEFEFRPGIRDNNNFLFSYPNNLYMASGIFGKSVGMWTIGTLIVVKYYQNSDYDTAAKKNNEIQGIPELFVQADFGPLYVRALGGGLKFLDKSSNENSLKKKFLPAIGGEIGIPISDDMVIKANILGILQNTADISISGTSVSVTSGPILVGSIGLTTIF